MTAQISSNVMTGKVRLDFGWKHITLQVPRAGSIRKRGFVLLGGLGTSSNKAGKSLSNTNVDSYFGLTWKVLQFLVNLFNENNK